MPGMNTNIAGANSTTNANSSFQESTVASAILPSHATSPVATFSATVARAFASATLASPSAFVLATLFSNQAPARFAIYPINPKNHYSLLLPSFSCLCLSVFTCLSIR